MNIDFSLSYFISNTHKRTKLCLHRSEFDTTSDNEASCFTSISLEYIQKGGIHIFSVATKQVTFSQWIMRTRRHCKFRLNGGTFFISDGALILVKLSQKGAKKIQLHYNCSDFEEKSVYDCEGFFSVVFLQTYSFIGHQECDLCFHAKGPAV